MESEKAKEIKKVLEQNTKTCLLYDFGKETECKVFYCKDILDYINELESENEKLKRHKRELEGGQHDLCVLNKEQTLRIAELENENDELKVDLKNSIDMQKQMLDGFNTATKEVEENLAREIPNLLKQFAVRLKERILSTPHILGGEGTIIDETLKECIK
jgi:hypothetical protein